jgi:hypothetical protein
MAAQLLLINPKRRRKAKRARSHRRRKVARNPARRRHRARRVARNPRRRHVARNPIRRRRHIARNPHRRRRIRRNPFSSRGITSALIPAGIGAMGAVGLDVLMGYAAAYLPASLTSNVYVATATKTAGAFGLGWLASKAMGREKAKLITAGALTVIAYQFVKGIIHEAAPSLPGLAGGDFGAYQLGAYQMGALPVPLMRANPVGLSGYNPAPYLNGVTDFGPGVNDSMF